MNKRKLVVTLPFIIATVMLSVPAASTLIFGMIGRVPDEQGWYGTVAFFIGLLLSTTALVASLFTPKESLTSKILTTISAALSGSWLGFYYSEVMSGLKTQPISMVAAAIAALLMASIGFYCRFRLVDIAIVILGVVAAYGLAFMCSTATFAYLSTGHFLAGLLWGGLSLLVIASIIFLLSVLFQEIGEELTYAKKSGHSQRV
jgi:hypothetical protein